MDGVLEIIKEFMKQSKDGDKEAGFELVDEEEVELVLGLFVPEEACGDYTIMESGVFLDRGDSLGEFFYWVTNSGLRWFTGKCVTDHLVRQGAYSSMCNRVPIVYCVNFVLK